ncbi:cobalamin biosynthesis protein [Calidifontibacter sp. DB0510]|uniref:Cobalamin biosynthesis protein CobD n=1 Tax=Metallococcus carri TaxID=1656884 RepID=A0A967B4W5_9MICO|nr:cobalamin biosynthesis protein [Metallococcus carri]NHN54686.1 cobalamin biosynthesis protein [Metallococcus carri]NOP37031.1 cobalamin biosynthesis protein [Calidifontibacter sp. DB2511S]
MKHHRAAGLVLGVAFDHAFGDPRRWHPVAGFGWVATHLEQRTYPIDATSRRLAGAAHTAVLVATAAATGALAERGSRRPILVTAIATWVVLGGRSLDREATAIAHLLAKDDLAGARQRIRHLVGRDPTGLTADEIARACVESIAENTSDAVVAPLLWGATAGIPGLFGYRAVNTLDAMIGHRTERYREFGMPAARLDDVANWLPARLTAALVAAAAPVVGGAPRAALRAWRRDARQHPSPNAGPVEASFAGALGVRLGGVNRYGNRVEDRGHLGEGPAPTPADIARVVRLSRAVQLAALAVSVMIAGRSEAPRRSLLPATIAIVGHRHRPAGDAA